MFIPIARAHLQGVRRRRLPHRVRASSATSSSRAACSATPRTTTSPSSIPTASSSPASASRTCPRSCTCARTRRCVAAAEGWDPHEWQTGRQGGRQGDGVERARRRRRRRSAAHPRLAGLIGERSTQHQRRGTTVTNATMLARGARGSLGCSRSPYRGAPRVRTCCCWVSVLFTRCVQQGPKRPGRRSPHMNRRAFRLVLLRPRSSRRWGRWSHPGSPSPTRSATSRPKPHSSKRRSTANAEKLGALNEQINWRRTSSTRRTQRHPAAPTPSSPPRKAKTTELRAEVARRAAAIYTQSGSNGGVEDLDAQNAQDLSTKQKYSSLAAQRDNEIVDELAKAKEAGRGAQGRRRGGAPGRAGAAGRDPGAEDEARRRSGRRSQQLQSKVTGELARSCSRPSRSVRRARPRRPRSSTRCSEPAAAAPAARPAAAAPAVVAAAAATSATPPPTSGGVSAVLAYAYAQLGKPYCYAGVGPELLRLLGPLDDGVGPGRRVHVARLLRPAGVVPARLDEPAPARRPRVLGRPRRHLRRRRQRAPCAAYRHRGPDHRRSGPASSAPLDPDPKGLVSTSSPSHSWPTVLNESSVARATAAWTTARARS